VSRPRGPGIESDEAGSGEPGAAGARRRESGVRSAGQPAAPSPTVADTVYVHAPFCQRRCVYCDFAVQVRGSGGAGEWLEALRMELETVEREGLLRLADTLSTLYVGGGTPSLLGAGAMAGLADALGSARLAPDDLEWTAEANPESFTSEVAAAWREAGTNRLSLGVQTFDERALRWMGRLHGSAGGARAVETAREAGFENLSVDLIFGLPAHLGRSWSDDLDRALELDVPHVSLYGLSVEPDTKLGRDVAAGREPGVDEDRYADEFLMASETLTRAGYVQYELSNFARPGFESRHNARYWDGTPYLGLGNGAHSFAPPVRRWNVRGWETYRSRVLAGRSAEAEREAVTGERTELEEVWLGLRTRRGIPAPAPGSGRALIVARWVREGLAVLDGPRVRLTPEGWLLLDRLAVDCMG